MLNVYLYVVSKSERGLMTTRLDLDAPIVSEKVLDAVFTHPGIMELIVSSQRDGLERGVDERLVVTRRIKADLIQAYN